MPRHLIYGPVIFGVVGAACGVSAAMLLHYDVVYDLVDLDNSVPLAAVGAVCGVVVGFGAMNLQLRNARMRPWIEITAIVLLFGSSAAVVGWLFGDHQYRNPWPGTKWGAVAGVAVALLFCARLFRSEGISPAPFK
jgi:hypothetical protein